MAFNVLFGSRLLPKAMQKSATPTVRTLQQFCLAASRSASTSVAASGATPPAMITGSSPATRVGSRIWYRIPGWQGPGGWVLWLVGWTSCACFVQEIAGPYIFFHE
mmetsp:Transcript_91724/g.163254  ORF Transcript_91724/g.163254 Transcript_91724/m.163254 type:complete len:106 (-) Transcript_91724:119-436(-)|eukprot:CAMPEP_0197662162 /NCGR_PEP_ID=MMETSP1338-20131121/52336_1 /TAXON_ID=43686 ORGANISM="Pelagodinium beii, Strain RCC1491" /NCGR_SAMPLE_ID=MMETSP1338 /ASSEMBLY_ACC=CAM_ASM_000754 /LENGTH=105 /DNA_ID=CAMNT_0043239887 /DNA_START=95 /DNA_END=412 /DNA_ORIENTATION=+